MRIGLSIFLLALGAILAFAVRDAVPGVSLTMVGYILMGAGVLTLIISLVVGMPRSSRRVSESRSVVDPGTGEQVTRNETRDVL
ncbi:DUF6458 family protein [Arthrobacter halodurans]|jgi:hypothetical protein|uniref:DUF6458 family protein n=1 Tax=Arthrobacter halodurans TaxID=516699 RepID=A0ABV4UUN5_9MICC